MQIKEIGLRNFQSFGNVRQSIKLNLEKGELILLEGKNGHGKTTIGNAIDFTYYKKVKGKNKKTVSLANLPNRINKESVTDVSYIADNNEYYVERGINPNYVKFSTNNMPPDDKAGVDIINDKIIKTIGLDFETFKTFISMSINDFKNFISLSNEDKKILLDKMFNLEYIDMLNNILKTIVSETKKDIDLYNKEIKTLDDSIIEIEFSLRKASEKLESKIETDFNTELENIKATFNEKKALYDENKLKLNKGREKYNELKSKISNENNSYIKSVENIKEINKKLELYKNGQCPTCKSDFNSEFHQTIKDELVQQLDKLTIIKNELYTNLTKYKETETKALTYVNKANDLDVRLNNDLRNLKNSSTDIVNKMKMIKEEVINDGSLIEFKESIKKLESNKQVSIDKKQELDNKLAHHKILSSIFGENGVKNIIIRNIIFPINTFIMNNAILLDLPFEIALTENFDAVIRHFGEEINPETLSTGEMRKVNLAIMIAYLKLIRTKININVLFLDEIFSSVDTESINDVIKLLRDFADEYNINIFIVHHSTLSYDNFDRVIKVTKDIYTRIEEIKIK